MAKQFALDQFGRHRRTAHRNERAFGARAVAMERECSEFLARARFTGQQDSTSDTCHPVQRRLEAFDLQRATHEAIGLGRALGDAASQHPVLALEGRALQALPDCIEDLCHAKRLEDEIAGTGAQRLDRSVKIGERVISTTSPA